MNNSNVNTIEEKEIEHSRKQSMRSVPKRRSFNEAFPIPDNIRSNIIQSSNNQTNTVNANRSVLPRLSGHKILVNRRQRGNPLLNYIVNRPWEFADILPDYVMGNKTCALYLSLKYAMLHPKYIHQRMQSLKKMYSVRILFCHVDVNDYEHILQNVTKIAFLNEWTILCAWSFDEVAKYIQLYKSSEYQTADVLKEPSVNLANPRQTFGKILRKIKPINRTDVATLAATFGSLKRITSATTEELTACPGIGEVKIKRIYDAFHEPFIISNRNNATV